VTDLDGTLLRSNATLSPYSAEMLAKAAERGWTIACATARSMVSAGKIIGGVPWNAPLIVYNGAMTIDPQDGRVLDRQLLSAALSNRIIDYGRERGLQPFVFLLDEQDQERVLHEKLERTGLMQFRASRPGDRRFLKVERLRCDERSGTLSLTYIGYYEELTPFYDFICRELSGQVHAHMMADRYIHNHYFLEFSDNRANKGEALRNWCRLVGADPQAVTVFGDQLNDIGLFEAAGRRCAVANAHETIRAMADTVIPGNDEDGVARYLERLLRDSSIE